MKKIMLIIGLCLLAAPLALADKDMKECRMMKQMEKTTPEGRFQHKAFFILANADEIGLSDEQAAKIKAIKLKTKKSIVMIDAQIDTLSLDIADALKDDDVDIKSVNALVDKKYDLKKQKAKDALQGYVDLRGVLTKEQRNQLKQTWSKCMMGRMKQMMGQGETYLKGKGDMERMDIQKESE